jgi:hypothetical protein
MGDGLWLDFYLQKFTQDRIAMPFGDSPLFVGDGLGIMSYVQAVLGLPRTPIRKELPPALLKGVNHTHLPLGDARGHAAVFLTHGAWRAKIQLAKYLRKRVSRPWRRGE